MKEKKYKLPEDKGAAFVGEPTVAYHGNAAVAFPEEEYADEVDERVDDKADELDDEADDFDWDKIPVGWGPANEEEACARIEAIEADIEKNGLIDESEMIEHLKAKGLWFL